MRRLFSLRNNLGKTAQKICRLCIRQEKREFCKNRQLSCVESLNNLCVYAIIKKNFDLKEFLTGKREYVLALKGAGLAFPNHGRKI